MTRRTELTQARTSPGALTPPRSGASAAQLEWLPAVLLGLFVFGVVLVRPALPIDETRYLEVLREHLNGNWLVLHLRGEPYAEKPPLLFWLARALASIGVPPQTALRLIPAFAATLTVPLVARIGRRAGIELAGWTQAALLLPLLVGQLLFFDSLLAFGVWATLAAWTAGRDRWAVVAIAVALLAKGPVAFLFLVPFMWSLAPLRTSPTSIGRSLKTLALGSIPLATWALSAASLGGSEFARALLWDRWAGRVVSTFAHDRAVYFYLPVALVGALPGTLLLFFPVEGRGHWTRRILVACVGLLIIFTLISGKQAHYLTPAMPSLALLCAWQLNRQPKAVRFLRIGVVLEALFFVAAFAFLLLRMDDLEAASGTAGVQFIRSGGARLIAICAVVLSSLCALTTILWTRRPIAVLATLLVSAGGTTLLLHHLGGKVLFPAVLEQHLRAGENREIARFGSARHGLYSLLARREKLDSLRNLDELQQWISDHPEGLIVVDEDNLDHILPQGKVLIPQGMVLVARDAVHGDPVVLLAGAEKP